MRFPRSMFDLWLRNYPTYLPTVLHIASFHATDTRTIISLILPRYFSPNTTSLLISKLQKGDFSTLWRSLKFFVYLYIKYPRGNTRGNTLMCTKMSPMRTVPLQGAQLTNMSPALRKMIPKGWSISCYVCWIRCNFKPHPHYTGEIWIRIRNFWKTLFKPEECENAGFSFSRGQKIFRRRSF